MSDKVSVQEGHWTSGSGVRKSVKIEVDGALANDLSALLLTLPEQQFGRFALLSRALDGHIAGRGVGGKLREA